MTTTRQVSITLPADIADAVAQRVRSGDYASESDVVRDGLRALFAADQAADRWLHTEVAAAYDEMIAHPEQGIPAEQVRAGFAAKLTRAR